MLQFAREKGYRFMEVSARADINIDEVGIIYLFIYLFTSTIPKYSLLSAL